MADSIDTTSHIPYPALTRVASSLVSGVETTATSIYFSDKIMLTITQNGRLAQWIQVPLYSDNPTHSDPHFNLRTAPGGPSIVDSAGVDANVHDGRGDLGTFDSTTLLPASRFQPRVLLGAGGNERELMGQVYASQIASLIVNRNREESRTLLLGLGLEKVQMEREVFVEMLDLVGKVL